MRPPSGRIHRGRWIAALAVVVGVVAGAAAPAFAHATLESTTPPSGGSVAASPGEVVLHFDEQIAFASDSVEVYNSSSARVDAGGTKHPSGDGHAVEVAVPRSLPAGGYVVTWRVISADSHPVHGAFTFFIGPTGGPGLGNEAAQLLSKGSGDKTVGLLFGVVRFLAFFAVALLVGGAFFAVVIWPGARDDRRARRLLWFGYGSLIVLSAAAFVVQGPYGAGLGLSPAFSGPVLSGVWHTRYGHVYAARLGLLVVAGLVLQRLLRHRATSPPSRLLIAGGGVLGAAILATWGMADHAATGAWVPLSVPFDVVHLGAASLWIGGLVMTVGAVLPASRGPSSGRGSPARIAMPRFSQWALGAVIAVAVTGLFAAWRQVDLSWGALTTTPYGKLVIYKVVGFAILVGLASLSRRAVHGDLGIPFRRRTRGPSASLGESIPVLSRGPGTATADPDAGVLGRLLVAVSAEVGVALAVLGLTALLVNAQPANQAYAAPFSVEVKAGPDLVNAVVDPAKAGPLAIHMYILTADGAQANVPEVDATMSDAGAGVTGLTVPLTNAGPGHFLTTGFNVPIRGTWTIRVTVRTDAIDEYPADPITVRIR